MSKHDTPRDGDADRLAQHGWRVVHEHGPAWWNDYARRFPNSKTGESQLREKMAHYCVVAALREARTEVERLNATLADKERETIALKAVAEAARLFESDLSEYCDGPPRDALRGALAVLDAAGPDGWRKDRPGWYWVRNILAQDSDWHCREYRKYPGGGFHWSGYRPGEGPQDIGPLLLPPPDHSRGAGDA